MYITQLCPLLYVSIGLIGFLANLSSAVLSETVKLLVAGIWVQAFTGIVRTNSLIPDGDGLVPRASDDNTQCV